MDWSWWRGGSELCLKDSSKLTQTKTVIIKISKLPMAMASQIIASSSPTITNRSHLLASYKTSKPYLSSCLGSSSRFSPYIGLKHMGISISPKPSNPGLEFLYFITKLIFFFFFCDNMFGLLCREEEEKMW